MTAVPPRMIAVWCPDWPVTAARAAAGVLASADHGPAAVVTGNRVVACSHAARSAGVRRGMRRREAQSRCPELAVLPRDEAAEARIFEPVVVALESIAPGVEVTRPGLAAIGVRGPTRYFGSETAVLHALSRSVTELPGASDVSIGVADGSFAAEQAARAGVVVPPGGSSEFLADLPISALDPSGDSPLVDLLTRLGLRTLGAFAALPARDVLARFGPDGAWAHRQAGGVDDRPVAGRRPPVAFTVTLDLDPPVDRIDTVAFSARATAERFIADLAGHGLACTCLELQAHSEHGDETMRRWRHAGVLSTVDVVDRIRWQLEGWRHGPCGRAAGSPDCGSSRSRRYRPGSINGRCGAARAPRTSAPTGHWPGCRRCSGTARCSPRWCTVAASRHSAPGSSHGATSRSRCAHPSNPGRDGCPHLLRRCSSIRPVPSRCSTTRAVRCWSPSGVRCRCRRPVRVGRRNITAITSWAGPWPVDERWWSPDAVRQAPLPARRRARTGLSRQLPAGRRWRPAMAAGGALRLITFASVRRGLPTHKRGHLRRSARRMGPESKARSDWKYGVVPMWRVGPYGESRYIENKTYEEPR